MDAIEKAVRERAYELWDHAGRPNGRSDEFWFAAKAELERKEGTGARQLRAPAACGRRLSNKQGRDALWRIACPDGFDRCSGHWSYPKNDAPATPTVSTSSARSSDTLRASQTGLGNQQAAMGNALL